MEKFKRALSMFLYHAKQPFLIFYAVVFSGLLWALIPKRFRHDRPFQRKGVRLVVHTPYFGPGKVVAIQFGAGAGYRKGATLYIGLGCRTRKRFYGFGPTRFAIGLTNNANNIPLAGTI